ncbi:MAG: tRNA 2-thiouridine(34) synthase MnmA [Planctomycetota bacterium]
MKVFVAMSGGVDSSVAALLLSRAGHDPVGIHLRTGVPAGPAPPGGRPRCCGADEAVDARRVCARLGIPYYVQNTEGEFRSLIDSFVEAYARGETPNPCVACNTDIKFGALLRRARALGADAVATGHYARRVRYGDRWAVARARDASKDQSYVLYGLRQDELARARFPLGELFKEEVRRLAREADLPVADKPESQEICFVPSGDYRDLVRPRRPEAFAPGEIVDESGSVLGAHDGVGGFTVGQRKGLRLAARDPLYVLQLDAEARRVVVGPRASLGVSAARVDQVTWSAIAPPRAPRTIQVSLRYRAAPIEARVEVTDPDTAQLSFDARAWPVTPGQAAVFYDGDVVLGGGRITPAS